MTTRPHPSGADHWTRRTPERIKRGPEAQGAILSDVAIEDMCARFVAGCHNKSWLARRYGVNRITIWRHLKARGLI